jgi:hypothetical protein
MLLRKVLFTAVLAAAVSTPAQLTAQERGLDRAATASANGDANSAKAQSGKAQSGLPRGIAKRFEGETLPPGIRRTRGDSEPVDVEPEPDPEVEEPDPEVDDNCTIVELVGLPPVIVCENTP